MLENLKEEIKYNKIYLKIVFILSFLTLLPQFLMVTRFHYFSTLFFSVILLVLLSQINKILFLIFAIYINITSIILVHIKLHWGGSFEDRLGDALISPFYEIKEYIISYVNWQDYMMIFYAVLMILLNITFIVKFNYKNYNKQSKIIFTFILFLLLVNHSPFDMIKTFFKVRERLNLVFIRYDFLKHEKLFNNNYISPYNKIIIIQGESANKHHWNLYGYQLNTTPFINKLYKEKKLYKFNVIAPSNQTRYSVPMIFTKANVTKWRQNFIYSHSIITDFKIGGYDTYWISNQGKVGKWEDYVTSIAQEANHTLFFNKGDFGNAKSDIVIKNYLKNKKHNFKKEVYVFHLIGSHSEYSKRYLKNISLIKNPKSIIDNYDNTIFFTDYIIQTIFNYFKNDKVLIIYLSDHAEVVSKNKHGHGFLPPFKDEYEIPMIIYSSIQNKRIKELKNLNTKMFNMENMNYIIKYISYFSNELNISYSTEIFSVEPDHIYYYNKLNFFKDIIKDKNNAKQ